MLSAVVTALVNTIPTTFSRLGTIFKGRRLDSTGWLGFLFFLFTSSPPHKPFNTHTAMRTPAESRRALRKCFSKTN